MADQYESEGLIIIGVNIGEPLGRVEQFKKKFNPHYTLALDKGTLVSRQYRIRGVPTLMVINKQGNIIHASYSLDKRLQVAVEAALVG